MTRYWFKPKKFGIGAVPITWEGWALGIAYVLGLLVVSIWLVPYGETVASHRVVMWIVIVVAATAATLYVAWRKTDGQWQWRWTKRNAPKES